MTYAMAEQQSLFDLDIWSGKTYQEPLAQTAEKTSKPSSQKSSGLLSKNAPMFLCLTKENGPNMGQFVTKWGGGVWLGGRMMHNIGEFHNGAEGYVLLPTSTEQQQPMFYLTLNCGEKPRIKNPTKLSEILEENPDEKYRLSARACSGILNRAERRGKELPKELEVALIEQSASKNEQENQGGAKGYCPNTIEQEPCQHSTTKAYSIQGNTIDRDAKQNGSGFSDDISHTLNAVDRHGVICLNDQGGSVIDRKNIGIVRRLTPLECTRLQGYPDGWCDIGEWVDSKGKKHADADSPKYKALGNSIAIPFWQWLARRIAAQYENAITIGSLFDGIGGFPLSFERAGGKAIWASEIEPFCVAVTKRRFPE